MTKLRNYVGGTWSLGAGPGQALVDPVLGTEVARASSEGVDFRAAFAHARRAGGEALRALSFAERADLLKAVAQVLTANRPSYFEIALANSGAGEADGSFDIDGAIFTLKHYARAGAALGGARSLRDGDPVSLGKDPSFQALHLSVPVRGVAVFINAFNFPAWGLWEKAAPALLSGVPVFVKPATATAWLTQKMVEDVVTAGILPEGALSIVCGAAGDMLDHVTADDVLSFTGSAETALRIRSHGAVLRAGPRVNVEADSLNCAILGPDAAPGTPEFDLLVREVVREMTLKAGQKCTAIRRVLVPAAHLDAVRDALSAKLAGIVVGDPRNASVRMGPLVNKAQQAAVLEGIARLSAETRAIFDGGASFAPVDADPEKSAFVPPTLLACEDPSAARAVHEVEVFGPVATLMPYGDAQAAFLLARLGQGSLVASVYSGDADFCGRAAVELAESHGRVLVADASVARTHTGHGNVVPSCQHGGPGRAGGGEELGGLRALAFYHRRSAIQAPAARVRELADASADVPGHL
jgi:3,4-dehydroadipyl-CoA semialdehyde dehydrogenase